MDGGLRERKKIATREAISAAALRLAMERGAENVRVDDIAGAAGVSPRTYNNYFASREQAIVAAIQAERALRIGAALRERPADEPLAAAVVEAVVEQYRTGPAPSSAAFALIMSAPGLRAEFLRAVTAIEHPLAAAIADRVDGDADDLSIAVLAAAVSAAARVAAERWIRPRPDGLVVTEGDLPTLLREALGHVGPVLDAADGAKG